MANDWRCARCGAANQAAVHACQACGLIRGGVVAVPNPMVAVPPPPLPPAAPPGSAIPGWTDAPPAVAPPERGRRRTQARFVVLGLVVIGVITYSWFNNASRSATGEIDKSGELSVSDLRVGDCYDLPGDLASFDPMASGEETVDKAIAKPCTDPHHYEVFYTGAIGGSRYPTDADFKTWADTYCVPAFGTYVGKSYQDSVLDMFTFHPVADGWAQGDHGMQCCLVDPLRHALTSTLKGSGR